jgi:serine/threonine protein kinase
VPDSLIEKEFAGYRIDSQVGRGGMGVVYRATDLSLDRSVALKVLTEELAKDAGFRRRFVSESKLAASLDHPNVIPIHAAGEHDGILYIAMRFVPGDDLREMLRQDGRIEPERAAQIIAQVASALDAAHAHGLVHRDVKPANVLMTPEGHVYLTDFGLSKRLSSDTEATRSGMVLGTLDYIAPEQIRGETIGAFTDVYSLGCMLTHLLTGQVPFTVPTEEGKLWAHFSEPPPKPSARLPSLGTEFDAIVARAMSKRPADRYATAGEVGAAALAAVSPKAPRPATAAAAPAAVARAGAAAGRVRRDVLVAALTDPFNVVVFGALLVAGALLGTVGLMIPLALLVYAVGVVRSYRDPDTARRAAQSRDTEVHDD